MTTEADKAKALDVIDMVGGDWRDTAIIDLVAEFIVSIRSEERERCAKIAEQNVYMSSAADNGGNYGGPSCCEYGCGDVIARAIRALPEEETRKSCL